VVSAVKSGAWTAILKSRSYRTGRSREEGLKILEDQRGRWFSPDVTDALRRADVGVM
jgi:HD-GYP domain-containing protein (c-di-GMP phosphodiesterase class II)